MTCFFLKAEYSLVPTAADIVRNAVTQSKPSGICGRNSDLLALLV